MKAENNIPLKMKTKIIRVFSFTLLELFICIAIIALVGTIFGHKSYQALQSARICSAKKHLFLTIHRCHQLSIAHQSDWVMMLRQKKGGIECEMISETECKKEWFPKLFLCSKEDQNQVTFTSTGLIIPAQLEIDDGSTVEKMNLTVEYSTN